MKLADYLFNSGLAPSDVQGELGIKSRSTMYRYLTGERRPRREMMQRISEFTNGTVRSEDFADSRPPDCAVIIRRADGKLSAVMPWSTKDGRLEAARRSVREDTASSDCPLSTQLTRALWVLSPRARYLGGDRFVLDHCWVDARRVIEAANRHLVSRGLEPIQYPLAHPIWRRAARILRRRLIANDNDLQESP
jgi:hypothetical protein